MVIQLCATIGFTGGRQDSETGLVYLRACYYDPSLGRFISADPFWGYLEEPASQNRYVYVQNNPLLHSDPSGNDAYALLAGNSQAGNLGHLASVVGNDQIGYYFFSTGGVGPDNLPTKNYILGGVPQGTAVVWSPGLNLSILLGEEMVGNLLFNNCGGATNRIFDAGGATATFDIVPAQYFKNLLDYSNQ